MAGMLAGVESARRRRIHQNIVCSSSASPSTGPGPSLCLRRSLFVPSSSPSYSPSLGRSRPNQVQLDEKLGQVARQAKERLDERLHAQSKSLSSRPTRNTGEVRVEMGCNRNTSSSVGSTNKKKKKKKKKGWGASAMARLGGGTKSETRGEDADADAESECVICLEELRREEEVVRLECSHTFHLQCVIQWLHSHSICPCCRTPTTFSYSPS